MTIIRYDGVSISAKSIEMGKDGLIVDGCRVIPFREVLRVNEDRPRILVEVEGGMVCMVSADREADVDVLDYDNYYSANDEEEIAFCEDLMCEKGLLQKVW